jgi:hypothetical protein
VDCEYDSYMDLVKADGKALRVKRMKVLGIMILIASLFAGFVWWNWGFRTSSWQSDGTFRQYPVDLGLRLDISEEVDKVDSGRIRQLVFCEDGFYVFTSSDRVHAVILGDGPHAYVLHTTEYRGEPEQFDFQPIKYGGP